MSRPNSSRPFLKGALASTELSSPLLKLTEEKTQPAGTLPQAQLIQMSLLLLVLIAPLYRQWKMKPKRLWLCPGTLELELQTVTLWL